MLPVLTDALLSAKMTEYFEIFSAEDRMEVIE